MQVSKTIILSILLFVFVIVLAEVFIGIFSDFNDIRRAYNAFHSEVNPVKLYSKIYKPNLQVVLKSEWRPEGDKYIAASEPRKFFTNEDGYITVSFDYKRNKEKNKIIFVGGSITECNDVDEMFRFPYLTGKNLADKYGLVFDTLNYGVRGHTTQDSIVLLMYFHRYYEPQYLAIMHNLNDLSRLRSNLTYKESNKKPSIRQYAIDAIEYMRYKLNLAFLAVKFLEQHKIIKVRFPGDHRPPTYIQKIVKEKIEVMGDEVFFEIISKQYKENLITLVEISRIYGITPVLITQPIGFVDEKHHSFNKTLVGVSEAYKVPLIDLDGEMPESRYKYFFEDKIHLSNEGSILAAEIISKKLAELISNE
jgi:lysophospholipase L1-like esterase